MSHAIESGPALGAHQEAFGEVSFLLDMFSASVHDLMGGATASVGRTAGRQMAKKLPLYQLDPTLDDVLAGLADHMKSGYTLSWKSLPLSTAVSFGRCAIREVCRARKLEPGGKLCRLFHFYFDGIVNERLGRPVKSKILTAGEGACETCLEVR